MLSGGLLVALAIPALGLHTAVPGLQGLPEGLPIVKTINRIQTAFPGGPQPAAVVVQANDVTAPQVARGIKATAGIVTSAAAVMVAVFAIFASLGALEFKQMGVGLAAAILIDATIIRGVLLPATMRLLGEWNWYLPKRLTWIPRLAPSEA